jgi:hypothetical protein
MTTLEELQEDLALFKAARRNILEGAQEVRIGLRTYRHADLEVLNREIASLQNRIAAVRSRLPGGSLNYSVPVFRGRR